MGNIFQCCHALLSFFKYQDAPAQGGAEQSPLLSSEDSDFDSLSLPYNLDDSIVNPSAGITNPALEPDHFLFPDIILSSNPGGEVTLVEPMVCLLVSEEDEEQGLGGQPGDKGEIRKHREGRDRAFSEVETQTEVETQISTAVQTQTDSEAEIQTQIGLLGYSDKTLETAEIELCWKEKPKQVDLFSEAQTSQNKPLQLITFQKVGPQSINTEDSAESEPTGREGKNNKEIITSTKPKSQIEQNIKPQEGGWQQSAANAPGFVWTEQHHALTHPRENGKDKNIERTEHTTCSVDKYTGAEHESNDKVNHFSSVGSHEDLQVKSELSDEDPGDTSVLLAHKVRNEKDPLIIHTDGLVDQSIFNKAHMHDPENIKPAKRENEEQQDKADVLPPLEKEAAEEEGVAKEEMKTPFLVDRLFLGASLIKAPSGVASDTTDELQLSNERRTVPSLGDVTDLHEDGFTVRIQAPGAESFELQVSGQMLVSELHQVLMDHEITCHHTCFSLQLGNTVLDSLAKLHSIKGFQDGALIRVVEGN